MFETKNISYLKVDSESDDRRLDRWIKTRFGRIPQSQIEALCRKGKLKVNNKKVKASYRVFNRDIVSLPVDMIEKVESHPNRDVSTLTRSEISTIKNSIIFEDEYLFAINKPNGIASQGGTGQTIHIDKLMSYFSSDANGKPKLVHRLDMETSGVLVLAKTTKLAKILTNSFKERRVKKVYWALVVGKPPADSGVIEFPLAKIKSKFGSKGFEKIQCVKNTGKKLVKNAKHAQSAYYLVDSMAKRLSWLALSPITGRTHQLRVHLSEINCPIVGDSKYGKHSQENKGDGWGAFVGEQIDDKLHLHARSIMFKHPIIKKEISIKADLPDHMERSWKILGLDHSLAPSDPFL